MSTITKEQINEQATALLRLVWNLGRGTPLMTRIQLYCTEKTKLKLSDYLANQQVSDADRMAFIKELTAILTDRRYDELPEVPQGQTSSAPPAVTPAPAPTPAPKPLTPAPKPAVKPVEPVLPPGVRPVDYEKWDKEDEANRIIEGEGERMAAELDDPLQIIMAQLQKLKQPKPQAPGLTEADVRRIIKGEHDNIRALVHMEVEDYLVDLLMKLPVGIRARLQEEDAT